MEQAHRRRHRRDERHVGHRLVGEEEPLGHRREDERAEETGAPPEDLRDALVEQVHRDDASEGRSACARPTRATACARSRPPSIICRAGSATPKMPIASAWIQKFRIGFDQNQPSCAHQSEIQSLRARISRATSP